MQRRGKRGPAHVPTGAFQPARIFNINLRPGVVVRVHGVPGDLTPYEFKRIKRMLNAFVKPKEEETA